jgi:uncharacterized protein YkwD
MRHLAIVLAAVLLAAVAAVGLNAGDPTSAQAANNYAPKCGGGKILLKADEKRSFALHNKQRINRGLRTFCVHPALQRAARAHSRDMIQRGYFSHDTRGGGTFEQRLRKFGYTNYSLIAENIAGGSGSYGSPDSIMRSWMNSPGHRSNIINGRLREIGIGTYTGTYKGYDNWTMYTADFGTRRG